MKNTTTFPLRPHTSPRRVLRILLLAAAGLVLAAGIAFFAYVSIYYHPEEAAAETLVSDAAVRVEQRDDGWFFDGPSEEKLLVFYPGAKVGETAYAPFLRRLAVQGMDAYLVKMPFHLAVFGAGRAAAILEEPAFAGYTQRYVGGHSLGGAMAASFAASYVSDRGDESSRLNETGTSGDVKAADDGAVTENAGVLDTSNAPGMPGEPQESAASQKTVSSYEPADLLKPYGHNKPNGHKKQIDPENIYTPNLDGVILFAAYPTKKLDDSLQELSIYGSEDRILNRQALRQGREYAPADFTEYVIRGGNHAGFGNYGFQKGDGEATISAEDQQKEAVRAVMNFVSAREKVSF